MNVANPSNMSTCTKISNTTVDLTATSDLELQTNSTTPNTTNHTTMRPHPPHMASKWPRTLAGHTSNLRARQSVSPSAGKMRERCGKGAGKVSAQRDIERKQLYTVCAPAFGLVQVVDDVGGNCGRILVHYHLRVLDDRL